METYGDYKIRIEEADGGCIAWASRVDGQMIEFENDVQYEIGTTRLGSEAEAMAAIKAIIDSGDLKS